MAYDYCSHGEITLRRAGVDIDPEGREICRKCGKPTWTSSYKVSQRKAAEVAASAPLDAAGALEPPQSATATTSPRLGSGGHAATSSAPPSGAAAAAGYAKSLGGFITGIAWLYLVISVVGAIAIASQSVPSADGFGDDHPYTTTAWVAGISSFFFFLALLAAGSVLRVQGFKLEAMIK
jgi:hypothetical protein